MAQIKIKINDRFYDIACDDGQEDRLLKLAGVLEKRVNELVAAVGQVGEAKLLLMAGLLVSDELSDVQETLNGSGSKAPAAENGAEIQLASSVNALAERIETIAERFEQL